MTTSAKSIIVSFGSDAEVAAQLDAHHGVLQFIANPTGPRAGRGTGWYLWIRGRDFWVKLGGSRISDADALDRAHRWLRDDDHDDEEDEPRRGQVIRRDPWGEASRIMNELSKWRRFAIDAGGANAIAAGLADSMDREGNLYFWRSDIAQVRALLDEISAVLEAGPRPLKAVRRTPPLTPS